MKNMENSKILNFYDFNFSLKKMRVNTWNLKSIKNQPGTTKLII